jgi:hypothetical protein
MLSKAVNAMLVIIAGRDAHAVALMAEDLHHVVT